MNYRNLSADDPRDLAEDVRRLFDELERTRTETCRGECTPALDVVETVDAFEIVVDLPGVAADSVRVLIKTGTVVVVGEKVPPASPADVRFHMVERSFGRFARAVRLGGTADAVRARACLSGGELRIVVPKVTERRGQEVRVQIETDVG